MPVLVSCPACVYFPARNDLVNKVGNCEFSNYYVALPCMEITTVDFAHLHSSIHAFFSEKVVHKTFWTLLSYTVTKACTSPRNSTLFTWPFLLVRGWGLGMRLACTIYRWFSWGVASLPEGKSWGLYLVQLCANYRLVALYQILIISAKR